MCFHSPIKSIRYLNEIFKAPEDIVSVVEKLEADTHGAAAISHFFGSSRSNVCILTVLLSKEKRFIFCLHRVHSTMIFKSMAELQVFQYEFRPTPVRAIIRIKEGLACKNRTSISSAQITWLVLTNPMLTSSGQIMAAGFHYLPAGREEFHSAWLTPW